MRIKQIVKNVLLKHGTRDPFEICEQLGYKVILKQYNIDWKGEMIKLTNENIIIYINSNLSKQAQYIVCAHELAHAQLHLNAGNHFNGGETLEQLEMEREADMFTAYLLLDEKEYDVKFENMNGYLLNNVINEFIS